MLFIKPNKQTVVGLIVVGTRTRAQGNFLMFLMYARRVCKSCLAPGSSRANYVLPGWG